MAKAANMKHQNDSNTEAASFNCSHALRLSGREWLIVGGALLVLIIAGPMLWGRVERFDPGPNYRIPYELSSDYWLYQRHCRRARDREKILVAGDSVIWGHYVPPDETLTHYLNELAGGARFANLGLDGTHPAALEGLLAHYGAGLAGRAVVLHFNPLWLTSARHDLQTDKEFHFNHPDLVAQFSPRIPCYKAPFSQRLRIAVRRKIPFSNWTSHVRAAYYESMDLQTWTLEHPYSNPLGPLTRGLPEPAGVPEPSGGTWLEKGAKKQDPAWVELDTSLQWRFFRRTVDQLRQRGNRVFILVGPFNEHLLNETRAGGSQTRPYDTIKTQVEAWCERNGIPCLAPPVLPPEHYVDASHPVGEGYALLARELWTQPSFRSFVDQSVSETDG